MNDLKTITKLVQHILETDEQARNDDDYLYLRVLKERTDFNVGNLTVETFFTMTRKHNNLPPFESVRRTRQKVQAAFPELCGCERVEVGRAVNEEKYRAYATARGII